MIKIKEMVKKSVAIALSVVMGISHVQLAIAAEEQNVDTKITYDITIPDTKNGNITFSDKEEKIASFAKGDIVSLKVSPDEGYQLEQLSIVDSETMEKLTSLTDALTDTFTFAMPGKASTVNATFTNASVSEDKVTDVEINDVEVNDAEVANRAFASAADVIEEEIKEETGGEFAASEINWVLGKDAPKGDPIGFATVIGDDGGTGISTFSSIGSYCTITPGTKHRYGTWSTSEFAVETDTGTHTGYCAQPNLGTPSGTYVVSELKSDYILAALLLGPDGPFYSHWGNIIQAEDDYAMCHAVIGWLYMGSDQGLSAAETLAVKNAADFIVEHIVNSGDAVPAIKQSLGNYTCYAAYNNKQDIVWFEENESETGKLRVDKSYVDMSNLITSSDYPDVLNLSATFGIYSNASCTKLVETVKTNSSGRGTSTTTLDAGIYYIKELTPPTGFAINEDVTEVTVGVAKSVVKTIKDRILRARIGVVKKDSITGKTTAVDGLSLEGAAYGLYEDKACTTKLAQGTTDASGQFWFDSHVAYGVYYIKEISAPYGYKLDTTVYTVNVNSSVGLYSNDNNYRLNNITIMSEDEPKMGKAYIQKISTVPSITENNNCYSLAGAKFEFTHMTTGVTLKEKLVTDETGKTQTIELPAGKYSVQEIEAPKGFWLDSDPFTITVVEGKTTSFEFENIPMNGPASIELFKVDADTGESVALGAASLEGAQFTIKYYDGYYTKGTLPATPKRMWVIETKAKTYSDGLVHYITGLGEEYKVSGDDFYKINNQIVLPLGTISLEETKAPEGYLLDGAYLTSTDGGDKIEGAYVSQITSENQAVKLIGGNEYTVSDKIMRGDFKLVKVGDIRLERLANVPFKITSKTTGETHMVVTDKNGQIDTSSSWNKHSNNTNAGKTSEDGVWFSGTADVEIPADNSLGALPYDTYVLEEQRCESNEGYNLLTIEVCIYKDSATVDLGTLTDSSLSIGTTAIDELTGTNYSYADDSVTIIDEVAYTGLQKDTGYKLIGVLISKDGKKLLDAAGNPIMAETTFKTKSTSGTAKVTFTFDASALAGTDIVVFEELYFDAALIAAHKDINDKDQTIHFPEIGTSAVNGDTNTNMANASKKITIVDTVRYKNLEVGKKYTVSGILMDKETGKASLDVNGNKITAETSFTAKEKSGSVKVTFVFEGSNLAGSTLVAFEELKKGDKLYAAHVDIDDEAQTIYIPEIGTTAIDEESGTQNALADEHVTIVDTINYKNLTPGKEYKVTGVLMDKETGEALLVEGQKVTVKATFKPEKSSGSIDVSFVFDGTALKNKTIVVFETLAVDGKEVAAHADIEDEAQSIYFPEIGTTATVNGQHSAEIQKSLTITDRVEYKNLIPGKEYKVTGVLMDKVTGEEILIGGKEIIAEETFTAKESNGYVDVSFTFDAGSLGGKEVVVFEKLLTADTNIEIANHEDINDKGQTVLLNSVLDAKGRITASTPGNISDGSGTGIKSVKTGDTTPVFIWLGALVASGMFLAVYIFGKRKKWGCKH